jgi:hypothetical protein
MAWLGLFLSGASGCLRNRSRPGRSGACAHVSTIAYTLSDCTQIWTFGPDFEANLPTIAYTLVDCTQIWTFWPDSEPYVSTFAYT